MRTMPVRNIPDHGGGVLAPFRSAGDLDALPDVPGPMQHNALIDAASA